MITLCSLWCKKFKQDESGVVAIELLFMTPILIWIFVATLSYFDAYHSKFGARTANTVLIDMISREIVTIDDDYLDGMYNLFEALAYRNEDSSIRVTVVEYDSDDDDYEVVWSETRGDYYDELIDSDINDDQDMLDKIPLMGDTDQVILLDTESYYYPPFGDILVNIMDDTENNSYSFMTPRFVDTVCFQADSSSTLYC